MCYGGQRPPSRDDITTSAQSTATVDQNMAAVENLRRRLEESEERLERARAREAELGRLLEAMKKFVSVMEILENYLNRRYREQLSRLYS
ncbi:hypothetical protein Leryth_012775 [Lithospermum erythrorhizon]|uniref:Protein SKIP34 n=1 Tax=Lithospermum erythrorhizon TaxID=34254 RepID=A0AAV3QUK3_LITER|nr:hypothetical protein Leryth_012775 [Lithospermum erythrorhizon]